MESQYLAYWQRAAMAPGIAGATLQKLLNKFGSIKAIIEADILTLRACGLTPTSITKLKHPEQQKIDESFEWLNQSKKHHILTWDHADFPTQLRQIASPPILLYVKGDPKLLAKPQVAMVGSRKPTPSGTLIAKRYAGLLSSQGWIITSGMALGIDAAGHRGALDRANPTIAVMGTGLSCIYPKHHLALAEQISECGALVSEFSPNTPANSYHFPKRNRIISGLSAGVVVVEARKRSGSLITAMHALDQNREVFAIPSSVLSPLSQGCHHLLKQGANLASRAQDIHETLTQYCHVYPKKVQISSIKEKALQDLSKTERQVLNSISYEGSTFDNIFNLCGLTVNKVCAMLTLLELNGFVLNMASGYYSRIK